MQQFQRGEKRIAHGKKSDQREGGFTKTTKSHDKDLTYVQICVI